MRALVFFRQFDRELDAREHRLKAAVLRLDQKRQVCVTDADMLDRDAAGVGLVLDVAHQMSLVSYSMGSS